MGTSPRFIQAGCAAASAILVLTGCAAAEEAVPPPTAEATPSASPTPGPAPALTAADIAAWAAGAEWSYAPDGLDIPYPIALSGGAGTDDLGRPYTLGEAVGADLDGDEVMDAAIPITMVDGNAVHELWYIWRGLGADSEPVAEQVMYPIARSTRCGDVTRGVSAVDEGLQVDVVIWMPHTDSARSCAEGGTGALTRVIELIEIEGQFYPVQTAPVTAWGGVCPPTEWLDGSPETGLATRVAPPASAPAATDPARSAAVFGLREAPLLTAGGGSFFGFIQDYVETDPVRMHCAFAD